MLDHTATSWLRRLVTWLEPFEADFGRASQRGTLRRYMTGILSDNRHKSMETIWTHLNDPDTYLKEETDFIAVPLKEQRPFLGVCLGAQMLSKQLGGVVAGHPEECRKSG